MRRRDMIKKKKMSKSNKIEKHILNEGDFRKDLGQKSHFWFFNLYLSEYVKFPTAPFQKDLFLMTEDESINMAVVVAFRNSAKSTIFTLSYPIWSIIGEQKKKFVLILSQTLPQARLHLTNIKRELESNELLKKDIGPFKEESDEWGSISLVLPKFNARITCASTEQSIRGLRHGSFRPDVIIVDDVEDIQSTKHTESRDKLFAWFTGEVIPCGEPGKTRIFLIGNLLHEDSLLMRLKKSIEKNDLTGVFRAYPLVNEAGQILWPGKFPDKNAIESLRRTVNDDIAWQREFMLRIIISTEQVIHKDWIQRYEKFPEIQGTGYRFTGTGIDLAIKDTEKSDYTAMVSARIHGYGDNMRIYIFPNPINEKLGFPETRERVKQLSAAISPDGFSTTLFIEDVGYQAALIQEFKNMGYDAEGVTVAGRDKRARLALVSYMVQNGQVLFPEFGCEDLIKQLVSFGSEKHDDLADAFGVLMLKILDKKDKSPEFMMVSCTSLYPDINYG